jgi:Fe-S-cluster-containing dehydrogenase component
MVIDANACVGCDTCFIGCKDEFVGNAFPPYTAAAPETTYGYYPGPTPLGGTASAGAWVKHGQNWMKMTKVVRGTFPGLKVTNYVEPCMQCANAPCLKAATGGAVYRRPDGVVVFDPVKSVGQSQIAAACPYGRAYFNPETNLVQKCTFCVHLVDAGKNPKCVDLCPTSAIHFGDLDSPASDVAKFLVSSKAAPLHPEYSTQPNVLYAGLPKTFFKGKLFDSSTKNVLQGATVTLTDSVGNKTSATVDNWGDFEIDGLKKGAMYKVDVQSAGYYSKTFEVYFNTDKYMGDLTLIKSL